MPREYQRDFQIPDTIPSGLVLVMDSRHGDYRIRLADKQDPINWEHGTFDLENSNLTCRFFPRSWGSSYTAVIRALFECSRHAKSGWLMPEESIYSAQVLNRTSRALGYRSPRGGPIFRLNIESRYRPSANTSAQL